MTKQTLYFGTGKTYSAAMTIVNHLKQKGFQAYFVGGCVRDALLALPCKDIDIVTDALPDQVEQLFSHTIPIGKNFGVINVIVDKQNFEVATFRAEADYTDGRHPQKIEFSDAKNDAQRRDFTINAIFYDPIEEKILDFFGGQEDLKNKILRTVGSASERFNEDYLRMLRAVRFAARFDLQADPEIKNSCQQLAENITKISVERIYKELSSMLTNPHPDIAMTLLADWGLMKWVLPEVLDLKGCEQPPRYHPEGDAWNHTMLALANMKNPTLDLTWSVLLHDIGKPASLQYRDGVPRTPGHALVGSKIATRILTRLHATKNTINQVGLAVYHHMGFFDVPKMKTSTFLKFINQPHFDELLELHRLDCASGPKTYETYDFCQEKIKELQASSQKDLPAPWISGYDLIKLKLKPGEKFKKIIKELYDLQLDGKLHNKEEAVSYIKQHYCK